MSIRKRIIMSLLTLALVALATGCQSGPQVAAEAPTPATTAVQQVTINKVKGKIKTVVGKSHTISIEVPQKGLMVFKFTPETKFVNAGSYKDLAADELLDIEFRTAGAENVATVLKKVVAELPKGVALMKIDEAQALVEKGPKAGNYTMFDSRPGTRYHEGHIPGSQSLPFAEMEKLDKEGKLAAKLPADKNALLVFYCGGPT